MLPGAGPALALYDSVRQEVVPVSVETRAVDGVQDHVRLYVCGITPYDATHLGHAATYVAFDTCIRALTQSGVEVEYAQNITDVDDPLFERATATGVDWRELGKSQTDLFRSDMAALRVIPPRAYVGVEDAISEIGAAVARLRSVGVAYTVPTPDADGDDVYLDLHAVQEQTAFRIGAISHYSPQELSEKFVEFGGDPDREGKRCVYDPLLWRAARHDEPSWQTEAGVGRPGWHVECAVIALGTLAGVGDGPSITIQGGGRDLKFPHHEMTVAHACALNNRPFATHFVHAGLIGYDGSKMSKSLGNLVLVSTLTAAGTDPAAIRLAILQHHYRSDWEWTEQELTTATERLQRWRAAAASVSESVSSIDDVQRMRSAIACDLDTPAVIDLVDAWAARDRRGCEVVDAVDALLGISLR